MDMIEKVARALCDDTLKRWRSPIALRAEPWRGFIPAARAAIEAMREPTEEMKAPDDVHWDYSCHVCGGAKDTWHLMIDAALKPPS